ncbi:MAG: alanine--tRNA ligase [Candidatus Omnitrophota bacterium]|nr:alanine--tRNA ligase [Candidatus Omnitrophota bacterium]
MDYKTDILRDNFLEFFKEKKHKVVESDSLVPGGDKTVLFTPAGMNQFKSQFLGFIGDYTRACSSQRCLRTDDLEKVGKTDCHHTFFEMLGNFSFGDYFKEEAISWAWEFLTRELKIPEEKLSVSVYRDDDEAYSIWKDKIKIPLGRIVKLGDKENFWPSEAKTKGPNGPCGPCSEIFMDFGPEVGCAKPDCTPACSCGRFVEIWNLVFTQYNRKEGGVLEPLPQKNIDTGMGLERLAAVMQGKRNNFETDLFQPIIKEIEVAAKKFPKQDDVYAVADHLRAIVFSIYDGVLPSNEGRGYVVRKLIRKSIMHLRNMRIKEAFIYKLVSVLTEVMKKPYPELVKSRENIAEIVLSEEKNFITTLNSSAELVNNETKPILEQAINEPVVDGFIVASSITSSNLGVAAFRLYDTYGIPSTVTSGTLRIQKIKIDEPAFNQAFNLELEAQKNRSKFGSKMQGDVFGVKELKLDVQETTFLGYADFSNRARILKIFKQDKEVKELDRGEEGIIILDKTVFYAESGGQVADTGELINDRNIFKVLDTQKSGKVFLHKGKVEEGRFKVSDEVTAKLELERRLAIARNHTSTHLLQASLRKVLGGHVQQQGSLVSAERLRFDFTHFKDIKKDELDRIESLVNAYIIENHLVQKKEMILEEARDQGALAFFGEKYENKVRVILIETISKELCAGTHLDATGQIGLFKIIQEGSIASGIRRIEARTGLSAYALLREKEDVLDAVSVLLSSPWEKLPQELQKKLQEVKALEKKMAVQQLNNLQSLVDGFIQKAELIKGIKVVTVLLDNMGMDLLRKAVDLIKQKIDSAVILICSAQEGGKVVLALGLTKDLVQKGLDAKKIIQPVAAIVGGSGGGRPDFAQAGGDKPEKLNLALEELKRIIRQE